VTLFVSTANILSNGAAGTANSTPFATLQTSEIGGTAANATDTFKGKFPGASDAVSFGVVPVTLVNNAGVAVWQVVNSNPLATDELDFGVWISFSANPGTNTPAAGVTGTVAGSFAPAPPAFDATAGAKASATLPIPRFIDTGSPKSFITINICRTNLLFPFVTNQAGFDTGLAIANTSTDPFGTKAQTGTCTLNFFGANAPAAVTSPTVDSGTVFTALASTSAPNFQGYVIAQCNFQFGHGFAFVSDLGARNLAMGYLALVMDAGTITRGGSTGEALNQ
jgi:hypothetical protein